MQNVRVVESGRLPPTFQRKACEARQHAAKRAVYEAVKVKPVGTACANDLWSVELAEWALRERSSIAGGGWGQRGRVD